MDVIKSNENYESKIVQHARKQFENGKTLGIHFRIHQLKQIKLLLINHQEEFVKYLAKDLNKTRFETILAEIEFVKNDCTSHIINLPKYIAKQHKEKSLISLFDEVYVQSEPKGVVLIIGTWNYPLMVTFCPLIGAIAAGNCAILKCSEFAPKTGILIENLCKQYLDNDCYFVLNGNADVSKRLLDIKFDHIFFTGSKKVGKFIYLKAAEQFTTVTLELGGKSPVYIDKNLSDSCLERTCRRLIWAKMINSGQTCVAPDYILLNINLKEKFLNTLIKVYREQFYSKFYDKTKNCYNFELNNYDNQGIPIDPIGNLLNNSSFERLSNLLEKTKGNIIFGGQMNENKNFISLTLVDNINLDDVLMEDEIFGLIFPIIYVKNEFEAIQIINKLPKPLSLYAFSEKNIVIQTILTHTSSGSVCVNDCILQLNVESLPFGGVGESGIGCYHGKYSFETFSHQKAVLHRNFNPILEWVASKRYPPYTNNHLKRLIRLTKKYNLPINLNFVLFLICTFLFLIYLFYVQKIFYNY